MKKELKEWIKSNLTPIVILGGCALGFLNLGLFGFKFNAKLYFLAVGISYGIFHIDGFWDTLKGWYLYIRNV